jgi:hypothetical protein
MSEENIKKTIEAAGYLPSAEMIARVHALLDQQLTPSLVTRAHAQIMRAKRSDAKKG